MIATVVYAPPDLPPLQGKNRVLVAFADSEEDPELQQQLRALEEAKAGVEERVMKVFAVVGASQAIKRFRIDLHCPETGFAVVLVGKDGGLKLSKRKAVTAEELFRTVDSMPMRREEIRRKR